MGSLFAVLAWLAAASAATLDATPEGARQIEDVYAAYFGRAAVDLGVVTTRPEGGSYVVTWDLAKALDAAKAPPGAINIAPFRYRLTPESSGAWTLESDAFPHMEFNFPAAKGNTHAVFDFDGFQLAGRFDPTSEPFLTSKWTLSAVKGEMSSTESSGPSRVSFVEQGVKVDASARTGADGGVDFALTQQIDGVEETIIPGAPEEGGEVKFLSGGVAGRMTGVGLKAHEIGEMWKYVVAHAGDKSAASGFAPFVAAALPLWRDIDAGADLGDLKILSLFGAAEMKRFGEQLSLSGVTEEGRLRFGIDFDDLTLDVAAAPPWAAQLSPASLKIALVLSDSGIGEAARLAVNDPKFGAGDLPPETQTAIQSAIMAGKPKLVLEPGRLKTPVIDLTYEGEAAFTTGEPQVHLKVTADSLDKAMAIVSDLAQSDPSLQQAVLAFGLIKGLAKTGADGRLSWDVDIHGKEVLINGAPMPK